MASALVAAGAFTVANGGFGGAVVAGLVGGTAAAGTTVAINATSDNLDLAEDLASNTFNGALIGAGIVFESTAAPVRRVLGNMVGTAEERARALISKLGSQGFDHKIVEGVTVMHNVRKGPLGGASTVIGVGFESDTATAEMFDAQDQTVKRRAIELIYASPQARIASKEYFSILFADSADPSAIEAARGPAPGKFLYCTRALVHGPEAKVELWEGSRLIGIAIIKKRREQLREILSE